MKKRSRPVCAELSRRIAVVAGSVFLCLFLLSGAVAAEPAPALEEAQSFLELVDAGSYQQAWWGSSDLLQLTSKLDSWVSALRVQREMFGGLVERSPKTVSARTSQPGLPDGEYMLILFDSRFERKQKALELLVLARAPYEGWKLVSYRLR